MSPAEYHTIQRLIDAAMTAKNHHKRHPTWVETENAMLLLQDAANKAQDMLHDAKVERKP